MDPIQQHTAAAPVLFTADGHPYYATLSAAAPLTPYQQAAPAPVMLVHPATWPQPTGSSPARASGDGRDVWPARLLCGGIGIGAAGLGVGFLLEQIAAATTGLGCLAAVLALAWLLKNSHGNGAHGAVTVNVTTHNRNR